MLTLPKVPRPILRFTLCIYRCQKLCANFIHSLFYFFIFQYIFLSALKKGSIFSSLNFPSVFIFTKYPPPLPYIQTPNILFLSQGCSLIFVYVHVVGKMLCVVEVGVLKLGGGDYKIFWKTCGFYFYFLTKKIKFKNTI